MGRHVAIDAPELEQLVDDAIAGVGAEVEALEIPHLLGVVLGGGYGRGEGGAFDDGGMLRLYNDLDFYVVADDTSSAGDLAAIGEALAPIGERWTRKLGVDVDFCPAKTQWRIHHDQERVMIQELVRGYFDVAGQKGETLFAHIERRPAESIPWMEAVRQLMNRGAGLAMAGEHADAGRNGSAAGQCQCDDWASFVVRNINKCILGTGDARLIAKHGYRWKAEERAAALGDSLYSAALDWKFRPCKVAICTWEQARTIWLDAYGEVLAAGGNESHARSMRAAARWLVRRRSIGRISTFGLDPTLRVLERVANHIRNRTPLSFATRKDWNIFN